MTLRILLRLDEPPVSESLDFVFDLLSTPNRSDQTDDQNADFVRLRSMTTAFEARINGILYGLELSFGNLSANGFTTINEFHVHENKTATGSVYGRLVEIEEPSAPGNFENDDAANRWANARDEFMPLDPEAALGSDPITAALADLGRRQQEILSELAGLEEELANAAASAEQERVRLVQDRDEAVADAEELRAKLQQDIAAAESEYLGETGKANANLERAKARHEKNTAIAQRRYDSDVAQILKLPGIVQPYFLVQAQNRLTDSLAQAAAELAMATADHAAAIQKAIATRDAEVAKATTDLARLESELAAELAAIDAALAAIDPNLQATLTGAAALKPQLELELAALNAEIRYLKTRQAEIAASVPTVTG